MVNRKWIKNNLIFNIMNLVLEKLNPLITKCGLDDVDKI